ncbi:kinesin-like protein KIF16B isoform X1 [Octopus bimaculoides]|uniref:Kinesin motor domain-containing protein n=1 Tax=Octopus bimaculoides TaxID=37653 RepID=A0A0L8GFH0_OCTBM|nr:kinesin-like protein KIF16B isoform X1 [Octopus bimaculoides]|eukprot:XP_014781484.1 PREDICTED: kinesin-like protein KIF16B isoform X1 [Octopus bimaculoides]
MTSVKVAVRVRPINQREEELDSKFIISMEDNKTTIINNKIPETVSEGDCGRESMRVKEFTFDFSFWSASKATNFASQDHVFQSLGLDVVRSAYDGYNACVFAYGQTGSGKSYTMMGNQDDHGLIPRICKELFSRMVDGNSSYRTEVSFLEIYNEKVRDLLQKTHADDKGLHTLRVREHPKDGPYVQELSKHYVHNYDDIKSLMDYGNINRTTAATNMNDVSSRSHAIFTILFTQAKFVKDMPSEIHSKIHLVDLAGSERADATGATGQRLKEGASINKSLVTLGNVISVLAEMSEKKVKSIFIPYRNSVLTWLLKDSLGGNSRTIMVATISPADVNYGETLSTLRYANRAKNIINRPTINEDPNVRLIRELRAEIARLRAMLGGNIDNITTPKVQEKLHENEARVKVLTDEWAGKWKETACILQEQTTLALRKEGLGVVLDSELPHLIGIDDDILSTGIMLYHLKAGKTTIGRGDAEVEQDIVLAGVDVQSEHCVIENDDSVVTLYPINNALCTINGANIQGSAKLTQGAVILLGKTNMFRFNHPAEAAKMREELKSCNLTFSRTSLLSQSMNDLYRSTDSLNIVGMSGDFDLVHRQEIEMLEEKRQEIENMEEKHRQAEMDRLCKQAELEKELQIKRSQLNSLQLEMEKAQDETKKVQLQVRQEQAKLKRKSQEIEKQFKDYLEEKEKFQLEKEMERIKRQKETEEEIAKRLAERSASCCTEVENELKKLTQEETVLRNNLMKTKELLEKEIHDLELKQEAKLNLEQQIEDIEMEKLNKETKLEAMTQQYDQQKADLEYQKQKMRRELEGDKRIIEGLTYELQEAGKKFSEFTVAHDGWIESQGEEVKKKWYQIENKEIELIQEYENSMKDFEIQHKKDFEDINFEKQEIEDAKQELEKHQQQKQEEYTKAKNAEDREKINVEIEELEAAVKELLLHEEEHIKGEKSYLQRYNDKKDLFTKSFNEQKDQIDQEKNALRQSEKFRIEKQVYEKSLILEERENSVKMQEEILQDMEKNLKISTEKLVSEINELSVKQEQMMKQSEEQDGNLQASIIELKKRQDQVEKQERLELERIAKEKRRLLALLEQSSPTKQKIKNGSPSFSIEYNGEIHEVPKRVSSSKQRQNSIEENTSNLSLQEIKQQYKIAESQLEEKIRIFEEERDAELERIEYEKYKLQELENQERINSLVEQEVRRRLFEEKVQREKQRRIEKEQEKKERDEEISRLKVMHSRELRQLKAKYERSEGLHSSVIPTKSNPYATVMSPDSYTSSRLEHRRMKYPSSPDIFTGANQNQTSAIRIYIPTYLYRGHGSDTHYEYEVKICVKDEAWSVFRRYSRFRQLHTDMKIQYAEVGSLIFPPKKLFSRSEKVVSERRYQLEFYLRSLLEILMKIPSCPINPSNNEFLSKQTLCDFDPFYKKGLFEATKHGTT